MAEFFLKSNKLLKFSNTRCGCSLATLFTKNRPSFTIGMIVNWLNFLSIHEKREFSPGVFFFFQGRKTMHKNAYFESHNRCVGLK